MLPGKRKQLDPLEKSIEAVLSPGHFISYNAARLFVEDVQGVADDIGKINRKNPERAARLYAIFIAACHEKADEMLEHIEHAKKCCLKAGLDADWQAVVADVRKRHFRKKGFMAGFEDIVAGAPRHVEPTFLERAKARWPRKSKMS